MSYEKVKKIGITDKEVYVTSACNNVRPLTYEKWKSEHYTKILNEKGKKEAEIEIFKAYEEGNFQAGTQNKYTKALDLMYNMFYEEYKRFSWRLNNAKHGSKEEKEHRELRNSQEFKDFLGKVLNTKIPKERFLGFDTKREAYIRKITSRVIFYTYSKEQAKKFRYEKDILDYNSKGFNFEVKELIK